MENGQSSDFPSGLAVGSPRSSYTLIDAHSSIEDEAKMAGFIKRGLEEEGSAVDVSPDGQDGLYRAMTGSYDS